MNVQILLRMQVAFWATSVKTYQVLNKTIKGTQ